MFMFLRYPVPELLRQVNFRFVLIVAWEPAWARIWGESMLRDRIRRAVESAAIASSFVFIFAIVALADDRRQNAPGAATLQRTATSLPLRAATAFISVC